MTHAKSTNVKSKLYRKYLKTPTKKNEETFKMYTNKLSHRIKIAKKIIMKNNL